MGEGGRRDDKYLESNSGRTKEIPGSEFCGKTKDQKRHRKKEEVFQVLLQSQEQAYHFKNRENVPRKDNKKRSI